MPSVTKLGVVTHPELPGVQIFPMTSVGVGLPQTVLVDVEPCGSVPLHAHNVDARMIIVSGSGVVLSDDVVLSGTCVQRGSVVLFERGVMHGFRATAEGLCFISENGGIVDEEASDWDIQFRP